jgi:ABC-type branched-subunit amino acid transport system substrate-binding protein
MISTASVESPRSFLYTYSGQGAASVDRIALADAAGLAKGSPERQAFMDEARNRYDQSYQGQIDHMAYTMALAVLDKLETKYTLTPKV